MKKEHDLTLSGAFLGEIRCFAFSDNHIPQGWLPCNGTMLFRNQFEALFALIGNRYGGDGNILFALPDLRGRVPVGYGTANSTVYQLGQTGGNYSTVLTQNNMPFHTHRISNHQNFVSGDIQVNTKIMASDNDSDSENPVTGVPLGKGNDFSENMNPEIYNTTDTNPNVPLAGFSAGSAGFNLNVTITNATQMAGNSTPVVTMAPFLGLNFFLCYSGAFPKE